MLKDVFIINESTCSHCGLPVARCVCVCAENAEDGLAPFGEPQDYLDEDGNIKPSSIARGSNGFAPFGLPADYLPDEQAFETEPAE